MAGDMYSRVTTNQAPRFRLFFFTDWRLAPLSIIERMLDDIGPVDLIAYGGDDVGRFIDGDAEKFFVDPLDYRSAALRRTSPPSPPRNWLECLAPRARHGIVAVLGNDDDPGDRGLIRVPGGRDLHTDPVAVGGWGFIGIEGAIIRERGGHAVNNIGSLTHSDVEIPKYLRALWAAVGVRPERLVIVSHTPPAGCLDTAIRFGFDRLGSPALACFIQAYHPAVVLCGHCHSSGGKVATLGTTTVVNAACDDTRASKAVRAALVDLYPDRPPVVTWVDSSRYNLTQIYAVSARRANHLIARDITHPDSLFRADEETLRACGFRPTEVRRFQLMRDALNTSQPLLLDEKPLYLPERLIYYDVETGLALETRGESLDPWMIAAWEPEDGEVQLWTAPDPEPEGRARLYQQFLDYIRRFPGAALCSWSGYKFDVRAVRAGLQRWLPDSVEEWDTLSQVDPLPGLRAHLVLPCGDWSLKTVRAHVGYPENDPELDGFAVGLAYEMYRHCGESLPIERIGLYCMGDVLGLAQVVAWCEQRGILARRKEDRGRPHSEMARARTTSSLSESKGKNSAHASSAPSFFGTWLQVALARAGMSPSDLAKQLNLSTATVRGWTTGRHLPMIVPPIRLAEVLGVSEVEINEAIVSG